MPALVRSFRTFVDFLRDTIVNNVKTCQLFKYVQLLRLKVNPTFPEAPPPSPLYAKLEVPLSAATIFARVSQPRPGKDQDDDDDDESTPAGKPPTGVKLIASGSFPQFSTNENIPSFRRDSCTGGTLFNRSFILERVSM